VDVEELDPAARRIRFRPRFLPERGWSNCWAFELSGVTPGETLELDLGDGWGWERAVEVRGRRWLRYRVDGGAWRRSEEGTRRDGRTIFRVTVDGQRVRFAADEPYQHADAEALVTRLGKTAKAVPFELAKSLEGRPVRGLRFGVAGPVAWVVGRQHAFEVGGSWVCHGLAEWLAGDEAPARRLRRAARVVVVPLVDVDSVELGTGGKGQKPHDHNRDWSDLVRYPTVKALMNGLRADDGAGRLSLFVDVHQSGPGEERLFLVVPPDGLLRRPAREELSRFERQLADAVVGPIELGRTPPIPAGPAYDPSWQAMSQNWAVTQLGDHVVGLTLEVPYDVETATTEGYRTLGAQLGRALARHLLEPAD
jgi:Zinc carboxypeptidase